jgi:hypothetical protein
MAMTDRITVPLRISPELHSRLKELAAQDERSLNAFIAIALARLVGASEPTVARSVGTALPLKSPYTSGVRTRKARPNELCPCGSGTKYKRCHGRVKGA